MKVLIIEDEPLAAGKLRRMIEQVSSEHQIMGECNSVRGSIEWLAVNECDLIFMDVQLSDGLCFEIFRSIEPRAKVVITTAYDQYAIAAFKVGSIDYLLKPIEQSELVAAMARAEASMPIAATAIEEQRAQMNEAVRTIGRYKPRFTIRLGDKILVVETRDIAAIMAEDKLTMIITMQGKRYLSDMTLDGMEATLDPEKFFRISRSAILNIEATRSISRTLGGRLKVNTDSVLKLSADSLLVSRMRAADFLRWIEGDDIR